MKQYPLKDHESEQLQASSGRPLSDIQRNTPDLSIEDLSIHAETLHTQAEIARQGGYEQLAANLARAAELTAVPNDELLKMYELLRPGRASYEQLHLLAERLESTYAAPQNAKFVREAAEVYQTRGLLRK